MGHTAYPGGKESIVAGNRNRSGGETRLPPSLFQIDKANEPKKKRKGNRYPKKERKKNMAETEKKAKETEKETAVSTAAPETVPETMPEPQPLGIRQIREAQSLREMEALRAARDAASAGVPQENQKKIVGIESIKKKDGSGYAYKLFMTEPYTAYERDHGDCLGVKVCDEYVGDESKIPSDLAIGDIVKINKIQRGQYLSVDEIRILNR